MSTTKKGVRQRRSGGAAARTATKQRKTYTRTVARAAWQIGWDGKRPVEAAELALLAGVTEHRLWVDRKAGLLGEPEPKRPGVCPVIFLAATARSYLNKKRPSALVFQRPLDLLPLSQPSA